MKFNKSKSESSEKRASIRKRLITRLVTLMLISLLISAPITIFSVPAIGSEPPLDSILNDLGFTNIALANIETFSPAMYNITLLAEFASYHDQNVLSYYAVETSNFHTSKHNVWSMRCCQMIWLSLLHGHGNQRSIKING